jgi:hypothetical protein
MFSNGSAAETVDSNLNGRPERPPAHRHSLTVVHQSLHTLGLATTRLLGLRSSGQIFSCFHVQISKRSMIKGCVAIVPVVMHWDHVLPEYKSMYKSMDGNVGVPIIDKESIKTFLDAVSVDPKDTNTFVALNKENHKNFPPTEEQYTFVIQWISAASVIRDHEDLCAVRQEQYDATKKKSGQWILSNEEIEAWFALQVPKASTLWINAIPGAGKPPSRLHCEPRVDCCFFFRQKRACFGDYR